MSITGAFNHAARNDNAMPMHRPAPRAQDTTPKKITTPINAKNLRAKKKNDDGGGKPG